VEKCWEYDIDVYQLYVDFRQAYDSIDREKLYTIMLDFNIPRKLVRLTRLTMENSESRVNIQGNLTDPFKLNQGLKQGDGLAPMLFNLALEYAARKTTANTNAALLHKSTQLARYADDINIVGRNVTSMKETSIQLEEVGLKVNEDKTKVLIQTRSNRRRGQNMIIGDQNFEVVNNFTYLGCNISSKRDEMKETQRRISNANKIYYHISAIIRSEKTTSVMLWKLDLDALTKSVKNAERIRKKGLRRIYGPVQRNEQWRIRYNHEIYHFFAEADLALHCICRGWKGQEKSRGFSTKNWKVKGRLEDQGRDGQTKSRGTLDPCSELQTGERRRRTGMAGGRK